MRPRLQIPVLPKRKKKRKMKIKGSFSITTLEMGPKRQLFRRWRENQKSIQFHPAAVAEIP
jgi:hypothetical protein